jgi:hypothetical protein
MGVSEWSAVSLPWFAELVCGIGRPEGADFRLVFAPGATPAGSSKDWSAAANVRMAGNWPNMRARPAPCGYKHCLGARFGMKSTPPPRLCYRAAGDPSGVPILDPTGFLKKGTHAVGVAR